MLVNLYQVGPQEHLCVKHYWMDAVIPVNIVIDEARECHVVRVLGADLIHRQSR